MSINTNYNSASFGTYDLGCAAALLSCGFQLLQLDRANPRKVLFIFNKSERIDQIADAYFSDNLTVKARRYFDNTKALKNQLYNEVI